MAHFRFRQPSIIPGFRLTFGFTIVYLALIVLIPIAGLYLRVFELDWPAFVAIVTGPRFRAAMQLSFGASLLAAAFNVIVGVLIAWVLVRYDFPGRRIFDAIVDLPFALPTAVAGIALTAIYAPNGWIGSILMEYGIKIAYTPWGVLVAMTFIALPFTVRTIQPVMAEFGRDSEEVAATLGATRLQIIGKVVLPALLPAILTGVALAFARAAGEYGSIIFIAGNLPNISEIAPLLIVTKLEEFDYAGAAAIGVAMLLASFIMLLALNWLQSWAAKRR